VVTVQRWSGYETRALRLALRMSSRRFASHLGVNERTVTNWEARGRGILPRPELQEVLDTALGRAKDEVRRRFDQILRTDGEHLADPPSERQLPESRQAFDVPDSGVFSGRSISASDVGVIRAMLLALTASDRQFGGGYARPLAIAYLRGFVWPCLQAGGTDQVQREMATVATEFVLRVASMELDAGRTGSCRRLLTTATGIADKADEPSLMAWVLARRGEYEIFAKRPARALAYTAGAAAMARHSAPAAHAFILGKHALALSMVDRDERAVRRLIDEAGTLAGRDNGTAGEPAWMSAYSLGHVRHDEARCYSVLGKGDAAAEAAEESMRIRGRGRYARPRAFSLGIQAIGRAQVGDVEPACATAHQLVAIALHLRSRRVRARLHEVLRALQPYQDSALVRELRDAARPVLTSTVVVDARAESRS
jgi:hypothetical protein